MFRVSSNPQTFAVHLQPLSTFSVVRNDVFNVLPIFGSVIVFEKMAQLMDNDVVHDLMRCDDDTPVVSDIAA
jgi:hypothetical protein